MIKEIMFTEEDINEALNNFCKTKLIKNELPFTASKIIVKDDKGIKKYIYEFCLVNNLTQNIPSYIELPVRDSLKREVSSKIKTSIRNTVIKTENIIRKPCVEIRIEENNYIIGGVPLSMSDSSVSGDVTMACVIEINNLYYALTCFHGLTVCENLYYYNNFINKFLPLGSISENNTSDPDLDFRIIPINRNFWKRVKKGTIINKLLNDFTCLNLKKGTTVKKYGNSTNYTEGKIYSDFVCSLNKKGQYSNGLIEIIKNNNCETFSDIGDSGSLVSDIVDNPLGIIIEGNDINSNTLVRPIKDIIEYLPINLKKIKFNF